MKLRGTIVTCLVALGLTACADLPSNHYRTKGQPEDLLSISSERVALGLVNQSSVDALALWVKDDLPTRAELRCEAGAPACNNAKAFLSQSRIPFEENLTMEEDSIALIYDRVVARDCKVDFVSNHSNAYNLNHPSFGCATAQNLIRMVGDHRDFVSPPLSDPASAEKAVQSYRKYLYGTDLYY